MDAVKPLKSIAELSAQYGLSLVLCLIVMGVLVWVLNWVFRTSANRELAMTSIVKDQNSTMQKLSDSIQANTNAIQGHTNATREGFDRLYKAHDYHRKDLEILSERVEKSCKA